MKVTQNKKKSSIRIFISLLKGSGSILLLTMLFLGIAILMSYITPQITRFIIDSVLDDEPIADYMKPFVNLFGGVEFFRANIYVAALLLVGFSLVQAVFSYLRRVMGKIGSERMGKNIRDKMYERIQRLPFSWHTTVSTGDIIQRSTQDSDLIKRYAEHQLFEIFRVIVMLLLGSILMFSMNPKLSAIAVSFFPFILAFSAFIGPKINKRFQQAEEAEGKLTAKLQENLSGVRIVRAFGRQREELEEFEQKNTNYVSFWKRISPFMSMFWASGDFLAAAQTLTITTVGAVFCINGEFSLGMLLAFIAYNQMFLWPLRQIGRVLSETTKVNIALRRLDDVLSAQIEEESEDELRPEIKGEIEFRNVSFSYDGNREILHNISFKIPRGSVFGIMGGTGNGKSTVVQLINRLYEPSSGEILIDGINIKDINRTHLRASIGLILQEPFLFSKTVKENIVLANDAASEEELAKIISIASLDSSIADFKDGLATVVGEKGVTLSGGQKQRMVIARTLIQKPPVVIFDDSLSAVDTETDFNIRQAIRENLTETTTVIISHRINSVMYADNIMILNDGSVESIGSHDELLKEGGTYKRLYDIQTQSEHEFEE